MPSSLSLSSSGCSSLIKENSCPGRTVGSLASYVHTIFALPQTVSKGSSYLCPLFILIVTVYYEQNYIPELVSHSLRKKMSSAHNTATARTPTSRGQRGDTAAQCYRSTGTRSWGKRFSPKWTCREAAELDMETSFPDSSNLQHC